MTAEERHARSWAADAAGETYELGRPGFPAEVADLVRDELGLTQSRWVADVAAGTGKLTRMLAATGGRVVAVEPMAGMRRQLRTTTPGAVVVSGAAERLPLRPASVAGVTVAQAFHWFSVGEAASEFHRVIQPGGRLIVVTNTRDPDDKMAEGLWQIERSFEHLAPRPESSRRWRERLHERHEFVGWRRVELANSQCFDSPEALEARFTSISFVLLISAAERAKLVRRLRDSAGGDYPLRIGMRTTVDIGDRA